MKTVSSMILPVLVALATEIALPTRCEPMMKPAAPITA